MSSDDSRVVSGIGGWKPGDPVIMVVAVEWGYSAAGQVGALIRLMFEPHRVRMNGLFSTETFYIGCSRARAEIIAETEQFKFHEWTDSKFQSVEYEKKTSLDRGRTLSPSVKFSVRKIDMEAKLGKWKREKSEEDKATVTMDESWLTAVQSDNRVAWSLVQPEVESIYRNFFERTVELIAIGTRQSNDAFRIRVTACPDNVRAYGPNGGKLGLFWTLGLLAKMHFKRPRVEESVQEISVPSL